MRADCLPVSFLRRDLVGRGWSRGRRRSSRTGVCASVDALRTRRSTGARVTLERRLRLRTVAEALGRPTTASRRSSVSPGSGSAGSGTASAGTHRRSSRLRLEHLIEPGHLRRVRLDQELGAALVHGRLPQRVHSADDEHDQEHRQGDPAPLVDDADVVHQVPVSRALTTYRAEASYRCDECFMTVQRC